MSKPVFTYLHDYKGKVTKCYAENEQELANNIIVQTADDYRASVKLLKTIFPDLTYFEKKELKKYAVAIITILEVRKFFVSDYYKTLSDTDGELILQQLNEELGLVEQ